MTSTAKPAITNYKQFYTSPWGLAFIAYFVAMGLVGAFTPADILKANPWAREFCDFMAGIVPQIDAITKLNIAPDINRFYFSVMWAGSPVLTLLLLAAFWQTRDIELRHKGIFRMPFGTAFIVMALLVAMSAFIFQYDFGSHGTTRLERASFGYPIGRLVAPQSLVLFPLFVVSYTVLWILGWLTGYIPRNIKYQNELEQQNG